MLNKQCKNLIIGGGIVGTSVAYHLSKKCNDVVLLEQNQLTSGSTWHAAGIIGQLRNTVPESKFAIYSSKLYQNIHKNIPIGYKKCGSINLTNTKDKDQYYSKISQDRDDIELEKISLEDIQKKYSIINPDNIYSGWWNPNDSIVNSSDICIALSKLAKNNGANILENTYVDKILSLSNKTIRVETNNGSIHANNIIFCTGLWTRQLLKSIDINIPLHPCHHFYAITEPLNINLNIPIIREVEKNIYFKQWSGGLCFGGFEPDAKTCFNEKIPENIPYHLFDEDWEQFSYLAYKCMERLPLLANSNIRKLYNAPESFTPDKSCIVDKLDDNIYVASGCNSSGIAMGGGIGKTISELILDNGSEIDISELSLNRFKKEYSDSELLKCIPDSLSNHYTDLGYKM